MKKAISFVCVVWVFLLVSVSCMADTSVSIEELGFSVSMPDDTYVFTRATEPSSSIWNDFDIVPEEFFKYLKDNNIYLNAIARDFSNEIVIIGRQNQNYQKIFNLSLYDEDEILKLLSSSIGTAGEKLGLTINSEEIYSSGGLKFFCFSGTQTTEQQIVYIKSYVSVVNGIFIQISLRSYTGPLSDENETIIKSVVDSIKFNEIQKKPVSFSISTSSNTLYKGLISGLTALIVGLFVVLIKGVKNNSTEKGQEEKGSLNSEESKTQEGFLGDTPIIYFCKDCQSVFGGTLKVKPEKCPRCGGIVVETTILRDDWRSLSNEQKKLMKEELIAGQHLEDLAIVDPTNLETPAKDAVASTTDMSMYEQLFQLKSLVDSGIITQEEFDAKKEQILRL